MASDFAPFFLFRFFFFRSRPYDTRYPLCQTYARYTWKGSHGIYGKTKFSEHWLAVYYWGSRFTCPDPWQYLEGSSWYMYPWKLAHFCRAPVACKIQRCQVSHFKREIPLFSGEFRLFHESPDLPEYLPISLPAIFFSEKKYWNSSSTEA